MESDRKLPQGAETGFNYLCSPFEREKLYLNVVGADVYFVICDGRNDERIPAHKSIMAKKSDVFRAMFYGKLRESGDIRIVDASAGAFKEFLEFFYFKHVMLTMENIDDVVYLSTKYLLSSGISACEQFLMYSLNTENIFHRSELAAEFDLVDLKAKCDKIITGNTLDVLQSAAFLECDRAMLGRMLKDQLLFSCTETDVFHAYMIWVKHRAKATGKTDSNVTRQMIDEHLGDLFYEMRFGSMTMDEFSGVTSTYGDLFSADEHHEITQMITANDFQATRFKCDIEWNKDDIVECRRVDHQLSWCDFHATESTVFSTTQPILLGEILLNEIIFSKKIPSEVLICERSANTRSTRILFKQHIVLKRIMRPHNIPLQRTIMLKPKFIYEIHLRIGPFLPDSKYYCTWKHVYITKPMKGIDGKDIIKFTNECTPHSLIRSLNFNLISSKI